MIFKSTSSYLLIL